MVRQYCLVALCRAEVITRRNQNTGKPCWEIGPQEALQEVQTCLGPGRLSGMVVLEGLYVRRTHAGLRICCDLPGKCPWCFYSQCH